ncbi:hypothetical protein EI555_001450, partial [Monodon monoceros]
MRVMRSSSPGALGQHEENVTGEPSAPGGPQPFLSGARGSFPAEAGASPHPRPPSLHPLQGPHPQGVKKKTCTPNISRKIKEEPKEEVTLKKEKRERDTDKSVKGIQTDSERAMDRAGGAQKGTKAVNVSDMGTSHNINIKKNKRETDEEAEQILCTLEKDDFIDDPGLRNDTRNMPVQLLLAHSGWLFKEENEEPDVKPWLKEEDMEPTKSAVQSEDGQMVVIKQEKDREARLVENACTLTEGQVGKLLICKSGKVQRLLGKVTLDVTMGTACSLLLSCLSKFLSYLALNGILCWGSQGPELLMLKSTTAAAATICALSLTLEYQLSESHLQEIIIIIII